MIRRIYLKMTGPQILASVSSMLCLLIDSIVISRFLGVDAMSAYGLVSPMIIVVNACILMISCGAQVSAAAAMGRGDMEDLSAGYSTALAGAAGVSMAIMVMVFTAAGSVCGLLGASRSNVPPNVMEMTEQYLKGYFIGTPFFFLVQLATPLSSDDGEAEGSAEVRHLHDGVGYCPGYPQRHRVSRGHCRYRDRFGPELSCRLPAGVRFLSEKGLDFPL